MPETTDITFSAAYERMKEITDQLNSEEIEPDALVPLLREGKGLESALRTHLTQVEQEVQAIEAGEGIASYRIVAATGEAPPDPEIRAERSTASAADSVSDTSADAPISDEELPF